MDRLIGWVVKAKDEKGKMKPVSGPFQTKEGAETYRQLYQKQIPESFVCVEQKVMESRG